MTMHNSARHERLLIAGSWLSLIGLVAAVTARQPAYIAVPLGVAAFSTYLCARHALALSGHTVPTDGALAVAYPIMAVGSLVGVFAAFVAVHEAGARITTVQLHGAYWAMLGIAWLLPTSIEASRAQRHESHRAARSRRPGSGPRRTGIPSHVAPPILINHLARVGRSRGPCRRPRWARSRAGRAPKVTVCFRRTAVATGPSPAAWLSRDRCRRFLRRQR